MDNNIIRVLYLVSRASLTSKEVGLARETILYYPWAECWLKSLRKYIIVHPSEIRCPLIPINSPRVWPDTPTFSTWTGKMLPVYLWTFWALLANCAQRPRPPEKYEPHPHSDLLLTQIWAYRGSDYYSTILQFTQILLYGPLNPGAGSTSWVSPRLHGRSFILSPAKQNLIVGEALNQGFTNNICI